MRQRSITHLGRNQARAEIADSHKTRICASPPRKVKDDKEIVRIISARQATRKESQDPFILSMSPGRDDVIILLVGETEKAEILLESKDLLAELCFKSWGGARPMAASWFG